MIKQDDKKVGIKKDIPYIHYLRLLACIGVLMLHCNNRINFVCEDDAEFAALLHTLAQPCVPIFFMITGALILPPPIEKISKISIFWRKRILKILFPLLFWGIVYSVLPYFVTQASVKSVIYNLFWISFSFPEEIGGILWYLYVLIGIYLIIPFFNPVIFESKKVQSYYLIFWFFSSMGLIIRLFHPSIWGESKWINSYDMLHYFSGYFGFLILGFLLHKEHTIKQNNGTNVVLWLTFVGLLFSICLTYIVRMELFGLQWGHQRGWFVFPTSIILSYFVYKAFSLIHFNSTSWLYSMIKHLSKYTFGIYLSHMLIYYLLTKTLIYQYSTAWYAQLATITITFVLSYLLSITISKLPFGKYLL